MRSLCQMAVVRAKMRWVMRAVTPNRASCVALEIELALEGVEDWTAWCFVGRGESLVSGRLSCAAALLLDLTQGCR